MSKQYAVDTKIDVFEEEFVFFQVRPKLGKVDIDYQKLHDAFFK